MFFSSWNLSLGAISTNFWQAKYCTILVLLVHLLQNAPELLHKNNPLVPYLSYQWNGCHIFQHGLFLHMLASVFCFLTCLELRAIVSKIHANGESDHLRIVFLHICNCPQKVIYSCRSQGSTKSHTPKPLQNRKRNQLWGPLS